MRFDDRLSTVLRQPIAGAAIARIQFRQLLDLLGTSPSEANGPQIDAAYLRLAELSSKIPEGERAAMLSEPMLRLRNPRLVAQLAAAEPKVAAAAISAAGLGEEQWLDLVPALSIHARGILRQRRELGPQVVDLLDRLGVGHHRLPPGPKAAQPPEAQPPEAQPIEGIGALVRRIEQFRKTRQLQEGDGLASDAPRLPLDDLHEISAPSRCEMFDFATDTEGRIVWTDAAVAPMAVGIRLAARDPDSPAHASPGFTEAFRHRQPIHGDLLRIIGAPAIAGDWHADAAPRFDSPGGRFLGYCGRMRRPATGGAVSASSTAPDSDADRMRQVLHELRTPVNAIQGFAEVIQQQLFGPTPHEYRALAATIASDGARMLAGFEELDRLVRLDGGALALEPGECDLTTIVGMTVAQLEPYTGKRESGFVLEQDKSAPAAMERGEAERLVWRLLATLAGAAAPGEVLRLRTRLREGTARIIVQLPASLASRDDHALFHATAATQSQQALSVGMFGIGFALRLTAAEARAAGGTLERRGEKLRLSLPSLTRPPASHSQKLETAANRNGG